MHRSKIRAAIIKCADGDNPDGGGDGSNPDVPGSDGTPDKGNEFKPPASQEELDKILSKAVARAHAKYKDYDEIKVKAARADALDNELASETDKAVRAARDEEKKAAREAFTPRLVRTEFRAQAKGVLSSEQLDALLEDLDLTRYVTDSDDVDVEKIEKKITAFAPPEKPAAPPPAGPSDLGQGRRSAPPAKGVDAGRSRYEATHKTKTPPQRTS